MRKTVRKGFAAWEFDEFEKWLNEMADEGWALISVNASGAYEFEETEKGEYKICMLMLDKKQSKAKRTEQIEFIEQTGSQFVGKIGDWTFFRRKSELGDFEIYSDNSSKINHLTRILNSYLSVFITASILIVLNTINCTLAFFNSTDLITKVITFVGVLGVLVAYIVAIFAWVIKGIKKLSKKRKELKQQATLFE